MFKLDGIFENFRASPTSQRNVKNSEINLTTYLEPMESYSSHRFHQPRLITI